MASKIENLKPSEYYFHSETLRQDSQETVTRKSFIHQPTKRCLNSQETHQNPTGQITETINRQFHYQTGTMIEQVSINYQSGNITTEIWPSDSAKKPTRTIIENIIPQFTEP